MNIILGSSTITVMNIILNHTELHRTVHNYLLTIERYFSTAYVITGIWLLCYTATYLFSQLYMLRHGSQINLCTCSGVQCLWVLFSAGNWREKYNEAVCQYSLIQNTLSHSVTLYSVIYSAGQVAYYLWHDVCVDLHGKFVTYNYSEPSLITKMFSCLNKSWLHYSPLLTRWATSYPPRYKLAHL